MVNCFVLLHEYLFKVLSSEVKIFRTLDFVDAPFLLYNLSVLTFAFTATLVVAFAHLASDGLYLSFLILILYIIDNCVRGSKFIL